LAKQKFIKRVKGKLKIYSTNLVDSVLPFVYAFHKEKYTSIIYSHLKNIIQIVSPEETLETLETHIGEKKQGAYMRFGDGDVFLAIGQNEMMQKTNPALAQEMKEAFAMKGEGIFKSLAIHHKQYGCEKEMYVGNHLQNDEAVEVLVRNTFPYFVGYKIFSPVALHYMACYFPEKTNLFLKKLKEHTILFIGKEDTPVEIINDLFGPVPHIKAPLKNAYDQIDIIEANANEFLKNQHHYGVVILAMGCSGRILMKRLHENNYPVFYFDFGSLLDGICGHITRPWLKEKIDYSLLLKDISVRV